MPKSMPNATSARLQLTSRARIALALIGFLTIATQRFAIRLGDGELPVGTLLILVLVAWASVGLRVGVDRLGLLLYLAMLASAGLSALVSEGFSVSSLILLVVTYSLVTLAPDPRQLGTPLMDGVMWAIRTGAAIAVLQFIWQLWRGEYLDPISGFVPVELLRSGFNSHYEIDSGQFKPNGMLFLEPSFVSLYAAIGVVFSVTQLSTRDRLARRGAYFWLVILAAGFAVSASASGLVVLAASAVPLAYMLRRNFAALAALVLLVVVGLQAGFFGSVLTKASEQWTGNTSSALRLIYPYTYLTPVWLERPFLGWGPGEATAALADIGLSGLQASTVMKLLVEYGLVGGCLVGAMVVRSMRSKVPLPIVFAVVAAWIIPSESLLNPSLVVLVFFALPHMSTAVEVPDSPLVPAKPQLKVRGGFSS